MKLEGKVIVVTGGARGIGRAMVRRFAREQPTAIVIADRDLPAAEQLALELRTQASAAGSPALTPLACDVSREADLRALVARARATHGHIDVFCSNAGI